MDSLRATGSVGMVHFMHGPPNCACDWSGGGVPWVWVLLWEAGGGIASSEGPISSEFDTLVPSKC